LRREKDTTVDSGPQQRVDQHVDQRASAILGRLRDDADLVEGDVVQPGLGDQLLEELLGVRIGCHRVQRPLLRVGIDMIEHIISASRALEPVVLERDDVKQFG